MQKLNFVTMKFDTFDIVEFPEYVVTNAKQLIEEAAEIFFMPRQKIGEHIFGDIRITQHTGHKIDLLHKLAKTDNVKESEFPIPKRM